MSGHTRSANAIRDFEQIAKSQRRSESRGEFDQIASPSDHAIDLKQIDQKPQTDRIDRALSRE